MKIEQAHIDQIKSKFSEIKNAEDLIVLLNEAKIMLYGNDCKPVQLTSFYYYANPKLSKKRYSCFQIKKKSGGVRTIHAPAQGLKSILRILNFVLQCMCEPHNAATGFVKDKSIVDNAAKHIGKHYVLNMDLKDFFYSFNLNRVKMAFMAEPFNLKGEKQPLAFLLASLCTHTFEIEGTERRVLPQGSPASPTITNVICRKLDKRLSGVANRFGATYTRYADDITFSSYHNIYQKAESPILNEKGSYDNFTAEVKRIIAEDHLLVFKDKTIETGTELSINPTKTRLQKSGYQQEATGLIVNEKVNVRRRYVKQIRMWLYYWEKYGYAKATAIFLKDYAKDKGHVKKGVPNLDNVIAGKLEFLKMVKGEEDSAYKGLKKRFERLVGKSNPINSILDIWEKEGIEKAMDAYMAEDANRCSNGAEAAILTL